MISTSEAFAELERAVHSALETYSNVHRGSGHNSMVSTHLFEQAREIVMDYMGLNKSSHIIIFCTPWRAATLTAQLKVGSYQSLSSQETGLPLGVRALAVKIKALPKSLLFHTGGGTTRLISPDWVIWANAPDRFEAGTPAIINIIAFARALCLIRESGNDIFKHPAIEKQSAAEILYNDELMNYTGQDLLDKLRQSHIGRNVYVPTMEGSKPYINFDNAASTPSFEPIWKTVLKTWRQPVNIQQEIIREVRSLCSSVLGASTDTYDIIFTSNTTEGINLAAESLGRESEPGTEPVVLNTILEHSSNDLPWRMIPRSSLIRLPADDEGILDLIEMETLLRAYNQEGQHGNKRIRLVAVSGASNVLGVFNDMEEIGRIVHRYGARLLVDAAQLVAHRKVDMEGCGIDYLTFSAHKVYAPFGCGVLAARKGLLDFGSAGSDLVKLSGEENAGGIAALGKALVLLQRVGMDIIREEELALTRNTLRGLSQIPGLRIYGIKDPASPRFPQKGGVIVFTMKGIMPDRLARELALRGGIGVRYGCHCAHLLVKRILHVGPVLENFQRLLLTLIPGINLPGILRVSLGIENTESDVDELIITLHKIAKKSPAHITKDISEKHHDNSLLKKGLVKKQMKEFVSAVALTVYSNPRLP